MTSSRIFLVCLIHFKIPPSTCADHYAGLPCKRAPHDRGQTARHPNIVSRNVRGSYECSRELVRDATINPRGRTSAGRLPRNKGVITSGSVHPLSGEWDVKKRLVMFPHEMIQWLSWERPINAKLLCMVAKTSARLLRFSDGHLGTVVTCIRRGNVGPTSERSYD